jgi:hypothetical protein
MEKLSDRFIKSLCLAGYFLDNACMKSIQSVLQPLHSVAQTSDESCERCPCPLPREQNQRLVVRNDRCPAGETYTARLLGHTDMPRNESFNRYDISTIVGGIVYLWLVQLLMPLSLSTIVYEKEKRLRLMMRMHGLSNTAYILVTYLYLITLYCAYIAVMMIVGAAVNLSFFRQNNFGAPCFMVSIFCT